MMISRKQLQLYFVMGSSNCRENPEQTLMKAIRGGITCFQFREKGKGSRRGRAKFELALQLKTICREYNIPFIVNDDVNLALEIDADGIHIGQEDDSPLEVRRMLGRKILGISAHNTEEARVAVKNGADYLGVGPMFPTRTKKDCREVRGPEVIREIRSDGITIPITGIGGIKSSNLDQVIQAGADGVAVISTISHSRDPEMIARELITRIKPLTADD